MSNEYTPTTNEVRSRWENSLSHGCANREAMADADWEDERMVAQFDRWLAKVKAEAQVEALREASDDLTLSFSRGMVLATATECHKKQCRCGNPAPEELARQIALAYRDQIRDESDRIAREAGIETGEHQ